MNLNLAKNVLRSFKTIFCRKLVHIEQKIVFQSSYFQFLNQKREKRLIFNASKKNSILNGFYYFQLSWVCSGMLNYYVLEPSRIHNGSNAMLHTNRLKKNDYYSMLALQFFRNVLRVNTHFFSFYNSWLLSLDFRQNSSCYELLAATPIGPKREVLPG